MKNPAPRSHQLVEYSHLHLSSLQGKPRILRSSSFLASFVSYFVKGEAAFPSFAFVRPMDLISNQPSEFWFDKLVICKSWGEKECLVGGWEDDGWEDDGCERLGTLSVDFLAQISFA